MPVLPQNPPNPTHIGTMLFYELLTLYPSVLRLVYTDKASRKKTAKPEDVKREAEAFVELDRWRYEQLPGHLVERRAETPTGDVKKRAREEGSRDVGEMVEEELVKNPVWGLEKAELERLVGWKLKHGTFRPTLLALIRSNHANEIKLKTYHGFTTFEHNNYNITQVEPLRSLTSLKGVGPATASLLLSVAFPEQAPFFGDEVFAWLCEKEGEKRKIKYDLKEYRELWRKVQKFREHIGGRVFKLPRADEVEKVGFVCGHWDVLERVEGVTVRRPASKEEVKGVNGKRSQNENEEEVKIEAEAAIGDTNEVEHETEDKRKAGSKVANKRKKTPQPKLEPRREEGLRRSKRART